MITVGLVREFHFISEVLGTPLFINIASQRTKSQVGVGIKDGVLEVFYDLNNKIWKEDISTDASMFGVESCDTIARIIHLIDNGSEEWKNLIYSEDKP